MDERHRHYAEQVQIHAENPWYFKLLMDTYIRSNGMKIFTREINTKLEVVEGERKMDFVQELQLDLLISHCF